jgi:hypothetical protein
MKPVYGAALIELGVKIYLKTRGPYFNFPKRNLSPFFQPTFSSNQVQSLRLVIAYLKDVRCLMNEYTVKCDIKPTMYIE